LKKTYRVTIEEKKTFKPRVISPAERAQQNIRNINNATTKMLGGNVRGPRRDNVRHFNDGVERLRTGRASSVHENSVDRFNKGLKRIT
jgi:hypothetical protein